MNTIDTIGFAAAILTTSSFVPQAWHTFRTRDVAGISLGMYVVLVMGTGLWLTYGLFLQAWPIVIANAITLGLALVILVMKMRFAMRPRQVG